MPSFRQCNLFLALALAGFGLSGVATAAEPTHNFFTTSDGVKIHYMELGQGTPVILIHGYTGSAQGNWFSNGVAEALAKNHRVVALDCRNHGQSDKPVKDGPGKAEDVIELMDYLKITKAHFHGYSMGGGIVGTLLTKIPDRFITAGFGGSGVRETDEFREKVPADKQGRDPLEDEASHKLRIKHAMDNGMSREEAEKLASQPREPRTRPAAGGAAAAAAANRPQPDLANLNIPIIAINGEFDSPHAKTARLWREAKYFTNVVLPGKSHLTAISPGYIPPQYIECLATFINNNDPK